jgi:hypothetical protein
MTTAIAAQPFTVSTFLFGEDQDTEQALAQALHDHGVLGSMGTTLDLVSEAGREAAGNQVAVVAHGLLDLDLGDLVVAGWRKQGQLAAAAERTAANPGSSEVVELATHRVSSAHHPSVELLVNDAHLATVTFDLTIEFVIKALVVTVRDGQLASRQAHFELPLVVRWPLLLRLGGGSDPLPYGAKSPPASPPEPSPSRQRRPSIRHSLHRQRRQRRSGTPAD